VVGVRTVTSLANPTVKAVRALHMRKARDETGLFVAEGLKNVTEGVESGHAPRVLLYGRSAADHPLLKTAAQATQGARGEVLEVTEEILDKVGSGTCARARRRASSRFTACAIRATWEPSCGRWTPRAAAG
jgi:tRNA G18 (ribose-2'-O)-methylase SpoU